MTRSRMLTATALAVMLGTPAEAYYQYIHFLTGASPFTALYEKFDLAALPNKTVTVYVTDIAPSTSGTDSFASVISQVKEAAAQWNAVSVSDLRVAFGGLKAADQTPNTPGIDVTFTGDLPGVLAQTWVNHPSAAVSAADGGKFFPFSRNIVEMNVNVDAPPGPSYAETYFTTAVHEMGHALGLQHTFTASAMSQSVVRNTTRTRALGPDDIAGLAALYGKPGWNAAYGSISGKVTSVGQPVPMASVVALPMTGQPVSALTNPDGTYRIDGVPAGQYLLYVHPLPPGADIRNPQGAGGTALTPGKPFETLFYPGTRDLAKVTPISVQAGVAAANRDFTVQARAAVPAYDVVTFSYFDSANQTYSWVGGPLTPAFLNSSQTATGGWGTVTFTASGSGAVPQTATLLGGFSNADISPCCGGQAVALYFRMPPIAGVGPRHLVLNYGNDMYVLPDGVNLVTNNPPAISALAANSDGSVTVSGSNLDAGSRIFFDGLEAAVVEPFSGDSAKGTVTVAPPPGFGGQNASVVAYNQDGQSSMTLDSVNLANGLALQNPPPIYAYPASVAPQISVSPAQLPAGAFARVEVTAANMTLADGQVTLGFGTDDITVSRVWLSGNRLLADVRVAYNAALGMSDISVISGFQAATQSKAFATAPANPKSPAIALVTNGLPGQATLYPGGYGTVWGSNLAMAVGTAMVALNDKPVVVAYASPTQVNFVVPSDFAAGPATLKLNNFVDDALPVVVQIDLAPPAILSVTAVSDAGPDAGHPAADGTVLNVVVAGLDPTVLSNPARVRATLGGADMKIRGISATKDDGVYQIQIALIQPPAGDNVPLAVWVDGSSSAPVPIPVQAPAPAATI